MSEAPSGSTTGRRRPASEPPRLLVVLGVGLLLGLAGPYGTYPKYDPAVRYAFWLGMAVAGFLFAKGAEALIASASVRVPRWGSVALVVAASTVPMTFLVAWTMGQLQPGRVFAPLQLLVLYGTVATVQLLIVLALGFGRGPPAGAAEPEVERPLPGGSTRQTAAFPAALLSRLPPHLGTDVLALESEDHYVRVHTRLGSTLVLMRLGDAVAMIDPCLGLQVHRRWWVSRSAVERLDSDSGRPVVRLEGGLTVPLGRTFLSAARAALK